MAGRYFWNRKYRKKKFRVRILAIKDKLITKGKYKKCWIK